MSQDIASRPATAARTQGAKSRLEESVKTFEWTWTSAVLFSLMLTFFLLVATSVMPSFWMYFAEKQLGWGGPTDVEGFLTKIFDPGFPHLSPETLLQIRDAIAMGLTTGPFVAVLVAASALQNWRKRLRGATGDTRPTGGYR
jgi:hypothetical protein